MRILVLALLALVAGCGGCASTPHYALAQAGARLVWPHDHTCSGTAVGPHTLLSAAHWFEDKTGWMLVNDVRADYKVVADDGNDHVLVRVSIRMPHIAFRGPKPAQG